MSAPTPDTSTSVPIDEPVAAEVKASSLLGGVFRELVSRPLGLISLCVLGLIVLVAVFAPLVAPFDPVAQQVGPRLSGPSGSHLMGTDNFGRDILSRVIFGARVSLIISFVSVTAGGVIGVTLGALAGFFGRVTDGVIMRLIDVLFAFPPILLGAVVVAVRSPGLTSVALAISLVNIPRFARLARGEVLRERELDYVMAAECLGASSGRLLFRHILRNSVGPLIAQFAIAVGFAVLLEASLSFIGFGLQPPDPSWGNMLSESRAFLRTAPWFGIFPGVALAIVLVSLTFLADTLRDAFDPRHRGSD